MNISPLALFKCLADETRLTSVLLLQREGELCVCELAVALQVSQPKVSRHLALLRESGLVSDRKEGQWVYYRLHPDLADWATAVVRATGENNPGYLSVPLERLNLMDNRPRSKFCC